MAQPRPRLTAVPDDEQLEEVIIVPGHAGGCCFARCPPATSGPPGRDSHSGVAALRNPSRRRRRLFLGLWRRQRSSASAASSPETALPSPLELLLLLLLRPTPTPRLSPAALRMRQRGPRTPPSVEHQSSGRFSVPPGSAARASTWAPLPAPTAWTPPVQCGGRSYNPRGKWPFIQSLYRDFGITIIIRIIVIIRIITIIIMMIIISNFVPCGAAVKYEFL